MSHRHKQRSASVNEDCSYVCDSCGEEIVIPIDPTQGTEQEFVEDCPVCCCPNVVTVQIEDDGSIRIWASCE